MVSTCACCTVQLRPHFETDAKDFKDSTGTASQCKCSGIHRIPRSSAGRVKSKGCPCMSSTQPRRPSVLSRRSNHLHWLQFWRTIDGSWRLFNLTCTLCACAPACYQCDSDTTHQQRKRLCISVLLFVTDNSVLNSVWCRLFQRTISASLRVIRSEIQKRGSANWRYLLHVS